MNAKLEEVRSLIIDILKKKDVKKAALFGSILKGDFNSESDIDILIKFEGKKSLLDLADLKMELEDKLGRKVDILTYDSIHPLLKDIILNEQVQIL
jgi:uncharacterized protein